MKNIIILVGLLILVACNKEDIHHYHTETVQVPGPTVEVPGPEVEIEKPNPAEDFAGNWYGQDEHGVDSFLTININADGLLDIESYDQVLSSYNEKSKSYGTHPVISLRNLSVRDGKLLILNKNFNFSRYLCDFNNF